MRVILCLLWLELKLYMLLESHANLLLDYPMKKKEKRKNYWKTKKNDENRNKSFGMVISVCMELT